MATPAQIKKIHALTGALQMEDTEYRELLCEFKVTTSKKLSAGRAEELIRDLEEKAVGMGVWEKRRPGRGAKTTRKLADDDQSRLIRYLWLQLHEAGKVKNSSEEALGAYVKRMSGVDRLEWLSVPKSSKIIEALKKWLAR